jgi:hypothetical protein
MARHLTQGLSERQSLLFNHLTVWGAYVIPLPMLQAYPAFALLVVHSISL